MGAYTHLDRTGRELKPGQRVTAQVCVGRYGQTHIISGILWEVDKYHGLYIQDPSGTRYAPGVFEPRGGGVLFGHHTHHDFEHGHETWVRIDDPA